MAPKHIKDVLQSSNVVRAQELLSTDQDIHKAVKDGFFELQHEIVGMRMARQIAKNKPDQRKDNGTHPAVTGLSVGGAKEVVDYFLALASTGDPYAQDLLSMSFVDGGLTALIATIAAWITKPNKKGRKK
tara:strand:- start:257 stop:646 length:390 start_codon:yes stop_codon:yes gene_type:complete